MRCGVISPCVSDTHRPSDAVGAVVLHQADHLVATDVVARAAHDLPHLVRPVEREVGGKKTVASTSAYRINLANITVSSVQVSKGKIVTVKIASGAPGSKFKVITSAGDTLTSTLTGAGAGSISVPTKNRGPLTLTVSDNGVVLQTTTISVV